MENILLSNLEFERDVIISSHIQIKDEQDSPQVEEPSSSQVLKYHCSQCDYKTNKKSNHDSHMKFVHFKEKDSCPECGKQIANLNQHLRVTHKIFKSNSREKLCLKCNKKFHNIEGHMLKAHNIKSPSEHVCEICYKSFTRKEHLAKHESVVHMGVRQTCQYCNKEFSNVEKHIKSKHNPNLIIKERTVLYPCDNCSKTFNKKSALNSHKLAAHAIESPEKKYCNICDKQFSNLGQHIEIVHNNIKNYKCQKCGKGFYDNRELRRHHIKYLKTGECKKESPAGFCKYTCDFENCEYKSNKKGNMEMHQKSVHLNIKYSCPECDKQLSSRANLNSHVKNVHDKKIISGALEKNPFNLKFSCKLCEYTTTRALHLDRHMLSVHSAAAFETVEQVYQASTQNKQVPKPTLPNPIKTHHPRSNAKLPQFANLVKLEKVSNLDEGDQELDDSHLSKNPVSSSSYPTELSDPLYVQNKLQGHSEFIYKDVQYVSINQHTSQEALHFITRRRSSESHVSSSCSSQQLLINEDVNLPIMEQTSPQPELSQIAPSQGGLPQMMSRPCLPQMVSQTSTLQLDASGRLIIPEEATILNLPNGLVLPLDGSSISPIYFASY